MAASAVDGQEVAKFGSILVGNVVHDPVILRCAG